MIWVLVFSSILLVILYGVESISWLLKVANRKVGFATTVARTNIWLYIARAMMVAILAVNFFLYDAGWLVSIITASVQSSLFLTAILHLFLLNKANRAMTISIAAQILRLPKPSLVLDAGGVDRSLLIQTAFSVTFFTSAIVAPILLVERFPDYALTSSISTQILNAAGTFILLLGVESKLYAAIDRDNADAEVISYIIGRVVGFIVAAAIITVGYFV